MLSDVRTAHLLSPAGTAENYPGRDLMSSSNSRKIVILRGCDFIDFHVKSSSFKRNCHPDRSEVGGTCCFFSVHPI